MIKANIILVSAFFLTSLSLQAATPKKYQVNLRVGLKGAAPVAVNAAVKAGKKASFTDISSDGLSETRVEFTPRKSHHLGQDAVYLSVRVAKFVNGKKKTEEKVNILALENQEAEMQVGSHPGNPKLSVSVLTHSI